MGPRTLRALLRQVAAQYPDAETLSGYRVGGARDALSSRAAARSISIDLPQNVGAAATLPKSYSLRDLMMQAGGADLGTRPLIDPSTGAPQGWPVY